ncbi:hypothetical protein CHUAL_012477 [Chamberlinius hualienensis]
MGITSATPVPLTNIPAGQEERETWGKKVDFLLSVIGFAVDLANVWRFPYLCYKNGGGAFLIPYLTMLCIGGIPLFYMELALGQYHRKGAITCWGRLVPMLKGIGYAVVLIAFYVDFYYNVIIAWSLHYFFASFTTILPWTTCNNSWNTENCVEMDQRWGLTSANTSNDDDILSDLTYEEAYKMNYTLGNYSSTAAAALFNVTLSNSTAIETSPAAEYFNRGFLELHKSHGIDDLGYVKWDMALCLLAVYLICYFSMWKGISTSGKVVWFTALFPYVVLFILLIRGITLPGAADGIKYYLTPQFEKLLNGSVWLEAATQVFFSLGPGFGVLLAFASYNKFHNNVFKDAIITSAVNSATSFLSGFVIFSVLGYMSLKTKKNIEEVATGGPGLVFIVYPEAIATMPGSTFWSLMFFMMLLTLGLDSSFGGSEAIITALSDEFPVIGRHREIFVASLFSLYYLVGLASCAQGGAYIVNLLDRFAAGYSILIAVFFEAIAISWVYGIKKFADDIHEMMGFYPGMYWRVCWSVVGPTFIIVIIGYSLIWYEPLQYEDYVYPEWANVLGWCIAISSVLCIPVVAIWKLIVTPGTFNQRLKFLITPWKDGTPSTVAVKTDANQVKLSPDTQADEV